MSGFAQTEHGKEVATSRRAAHRPSLSVILVSVGARGDLERALAAVAGRCRRMEAEIVVVRAKGRDDTSTLRAAYPFVNFLDAPAGSDCSHLRQIGMDHARGDIVALRQDGSVGDCMWLDAFNATVGTVDEERSLEVEVALTLAVEDSANVSDRRRTQSASRSKEPQRRRGDLGRAPAMLVDVPSRAPTLGSEM